MRARQFDLWTVDYLAGHPDAVVLHLGCGLDSRVYRLDPPPAVSWFDVDFPDVIELRRRLYPERAGYQTIGSSLADLGWVADDPQRSPGVDPRGGRHDVLVYGRHGCASEHIDESLPKWCNRIRCVQPRGDPDGPPQSESCAQRAQPSAGSASTIRGSCAKVAPRLEFAHAARTPDMPGYSKLPLTKRALVRVFDSVPRLRKLGRLLLYRF